MKINTTSLKPIFYFLFIIFLNTGLLNAQSIILPEQCDCDTSFVLNSNTLVIGNDTLVLAHSIYTGNGTTPANTQVSITDKLHFDSPTMVLDAQSNSVGMGTASPAPGAALELNATDKALLLTRTTPAAIGGNAVNGMIMYDTDRNCIVGYANGAWTGCLNGGS